MTVHRSDAIRTVPLKLPETAAAPTAPKGAQLTYRGGPLLTAVEVFAIFWGSAWKQTAADLTIAVNKFLDFIVTSALLDQLAEYSTATLPIGHGSHTGSIVVETPAPATSVTDAALRSLLEDQIKNNPAVPKAGPNSLYFLFLPPGVAVDQGGSLSCRDFCGYHDAIDKIFYGVVPYPGCSGCSSNFSVNDAITATTSHELCEAITDPIPGQGWYDDANGEIGDLCAWQTKQLGSYTVQLEWSNKANACA